MARPSRVSKTSKKAGDLTCARERKVLERGVAANSRQVGGKHYQKAEVQHWDFVEMHKMPYMEAQIFKYILRWRDKGGVQDLEKARHFLEKLQEQQMKPKVEKGRFRETPKQKRAFRKVKNGK